MTDHQHDPLDFSALDPGRNPIRLERAVAGIMDRTAFELARRRREAGAFGQLARWYRPMAAAAAVVVIVTAAFGASRDRAVAEPQPLSFAEYIGVPTEVAQWVGADQLPLAQQVLFLTEEGVR